MGSSPWGCKLRHDLATKQQQTLGAGLILHEANYSLTPCELYSAASVLLLLYSLEVFFVSERKSLAYIFRKEQPQLLGVF